MKKLLLIVFTLAFFANGYATHLVGGNLGYEFIGIFSGQYRYKVVLTTYTNCGPSSNFTTSEDPINDIGIYEHDLSNDPQNGGDKNFLTTVPMVMVQDFEIEPNQASNCSVGLNTCIRKGVYEGFVDLPLNFEGYHAFYERCCRNNSIVNLIPSESMAFHCYISPPLLQNSSPIFTDDPVPFLCVGDTTTILNSAFDPDGDLLTFSFVHPYNGYSNAGNPAPNAPQPTLQWTIPTVQYAAGYSVNAPFGAGGGQSINATSGLTSYFPASVGDYVVAVEIKEYRNGNLIGITRRDLQLLVLNCPPNPSPAIDPVAGTTLNNFTMEEGETLCFEFGYDDPNGDSVTIVSQGAIFNPTFTNPAATIISPVSDLDTVSTEFCWTTACGQAASAPYQFQVSAYDNGCPTKTTNDVYQITVDPVAPPVAISGAQVACQFGTETYSTTNIPNTTYDWIATGGTIVANNGSSVDVEWTVVGAASLSVSATNQFGCISSPISLDVTITPAPTVEAGNDTIICFGDTAQLAGTTSATPGFTPTWTPGPDIITPNSLSTGVHPIITTDYFLTIDIGGGCSAIDSLKVTVSAPVVNAGVDTTICNGDSVELAGIVNGPGTFGWTPPADLSDASILNPFASPAATTNYILSLIDSIGCIETDTVVVTISPSFTLSTSNDTTICDGDCANLSASGATSYEWTPIATLNDPTIANPIACPVGTTMYTVVGTNGACTDTTMINVTVGVTPVIEAGLDTQLCNGDSIQLNATGALNYVWIAEPSLSATNINNPWAIPTVTTEYFVTGSDAIGCSATDSITITINQLPIVSAGNDESICSSSGSSTILNGSGTGNPLWTPNTGLSADNVLTPAANPTIDTEYILEITDVNGCINTDTVMVFVFNAVPTSAGNDTTICFGDTIMIGGNPSSVGANTAYLWDNIILLDDATLPNPMAFPTTTTTFILFTNNDTCNGSDTMTITVNPLPLVDAGLDQAICINDTTQFNASGAVSYEWDTQATLSDSTINNPMVFPTVTTQYIVEGTDALGCVNTDTIILSINALPIVSAGTDTDVCINDTVFLNASGANTYSWTPIASLTDPNINNPGAFPAVTTTYTVTGIDINLCENTSDITVTVNALPIVDAGTDTTICINDNANLLATGATTYSWTPIADLNNATIANPIASNVTTTLFFVTGTDGNLCMNIDSVLVSVNTLPIIEAGADIQICLTDTAQLQATGGVSYLWTPASNLDNANISNPQANPSDTTMYFVTGEDALGCANIDSMTVIVNPFPTIDAGLDVNICAGDATSLLVSGGDTYLWAPSISLDDATIANPNASPDSTTIYYVDALDSNGCASSDTVIVNVFRISTVPDTSICINDSVQLNVFGSPGNTFLWTPSTGLSNPNIATPFASPLSTTTYTVSASDVAGCSDQDSTTVTIWTAPSAIFDTTIVAGCEGPVVSFTNESIDGVSFLWNFGDGTTDTTESAEHVYQYSGTFTTILYVTNANGCIDSASITGTSLGYDDYVNFIIPNVFTPNGDGENDIFAVNLPGKIYECVDMRIFNRWGQLMFVNTGNTTRWDGHTSVGLEAPEGTYFYTIDVNGEKFSGTLELFR
ncbi:MAG: gliding motility-associated-like protein [Parvicella sp.]|jgi:gliding motility-associated-like protein